MGFSGKIQLQLQVTGSALVHNPDTNEEFRIQADAVEVEFSDNMERDLGIENTYRVTYELGDDQTLAWIVTEYPEGTVSHVGHELGPFELMKDFSFEFDDGIEEQLIQQMLDWFHGNYEDPVHHSPYNSREGGYQYVHGGPYDALEELSAEYPSIRQDIIEKAVVRIEEDGTVEWTKHPIQEEENEDERPSFFEFNTGPISPDSNIENLDREASGVRVETSGPIPLDTSRIQPPRLNRTIINFPAPLPGPGFQVGRAGLIEFAALAPTPDDIRETADLKEVLVETVSDLREHLRGTNAFGLLETAVERYKRTVERNDLPIDLIYANGLRLENVFDATTARVKSGDLPDLPAGIAAETASFVRLHQTFIQSTPRGRELARRGAAYNAVPEVVNEVRRAGNELAEKISQAHGLFSEEARELVETVNQQIATGSHPERSTQLAETTNSNALLILFTVAGLGGDALKAGLMGSAIGVQSIAAISHAVDAAALFLTANGQIILDYVAASTLDMTWARQALDGLDQLKAQAQTALRNLRNRFRK